MCGFALLLQSTNTGGNTSQGPSLSHYNLISNSAHKLDPVRLSAFIISDKLIGFYLLLLLCLFAIFLQFPRLTQSLDPLETMMQCLPVLLDVGKVKELP